MKNNLPYYPTASWGDPKRERWASKIHYDRGDGYTLCGEKIGKTPSGGDGMEDSCELCLRAASKKEKPITEHSTAQLRSAKERQCKSCNKKSAISFITSGRGFWIKRCRFCGNLTHWSSAKYYPDGIQEKIDAVKERYDKINN